MGIRFDNTYERLPGAFFERVAPSAAVAPSLVVVNSQLCRELGLRLEDIPEDELAEYFSGRKLFPGSSPIAIAYSGHQFGHFAGVLGDGRAILLGEALAADGSRRDLQLKGAGQTPFSRRGDGRCALGPALREYLVSEYMARVGIPSTRSLAVVLTGEPVERQIVSPGAILTRVAASHIRVGTFEHFASRNDLPNLRILVDYTIERHFPEIRGAVNPEVLLLRGIIERQCALIPKWMGVGFIHGVMNTDNTAVSGETLDFGPCAFMDEYRPGKVFSSIDRAGRYAYDRQPSILSWNMAVLAECLLPLLHADPNAALELAREELGRIPVLLQQHWLAVMAAKLGIADPDPQDAELVRHWLALLEARELDFTNAFRDLAEGRLEAFGELAGSAEFFAAWQSRTGRDPARASRLMQESNPVVIPRNHQIERVIEQANLGNFEPFHEMRAVLAEPFESGHPALGLYQAAPLPEERVRQTFCGT